MINDDPRWDPKMRAAQIDYEAEVDKLNLREGMPVAQLRALNDAAFCRASSGGPVMAEAVDRWVSARGRQVRCRVNLPSGKTPLPALVYFHGGGWTFSSVDTHDRIAREYAAASGVAVVSVDYALAPESPFPAALEECIAVVREISRTGAEWGLDPRRIAVGGDSSGANLAIATALFARDHTELALRGVMAIYPVCDCDFSTPSYQEFGRGGFGRLTSARMQFYWSAYAPDPIIRMHPLASPLRATLTGLPPVLVQLAELDLLRSEGEALAKKLRCAGVAVEQELFPGLIHGFMRVTSSVPRAFEATMKAGHWLRSMLS